MKNEVKFKTEFIVVKDKTLTPLLGNKAVQALNLMTLTYNKDNQCRQTCIYRKPYQMFSKNMKMIVRAHDCLKDNIILS